MISRHFHPSIILSTQAATQTSYDSASRSTAVQSLREALDTIKWPERTKQQK